MSVRPTRIATMFALAQTWAERSTCPRLQAGVVFVNRDWQVVAAGYNGAPRKMLHCTDVGCLMQNGHCQRALHAEWNGIIQGARHGIALKDTQVFSTARPCQICARLLIQVGVAIVRYVAPYNTDVLNTQVEDLFRQAGIPLHGPPDA